MLEALTLQDIATFIGILGVIFGVPFSIAKYTNSLKNQIKEMQTQISDLERNFNDKIEDLHDELKEKNKDLLKELTKTTEELEKANSNNKVLYKVVKVLIDYQVNTTNDDNLKKIKEEFDTLTIEKATSL